MLLSLPEMSEFYRSFKYPLFHLSFSPLPFFSKVKPKVILYCMSTSLWEISWEDLRYSDTLYNLSRKCLLNIKKMREFK